MEGLSEGKEGRVSCSMMVGGDRFVGEVSVEEIDASSAIAWTIL